MMGGGADVKAELQKAVLPISVNPSSVSGLIVVREEQPLKASSFMVARDGGSSTSDKLSHPLKVPSLMVFNKGGNLNVVKDLQSLKALCPISVTPSRAPSFIVVRAEQPWKARFPIVLREDGSFADLRDLHPQNTATGRSTTPSGIVTVSRDEA